MRAHMPGLVTSTTISMPGLMRTLKLREFEGGSQVVRCKTEDLIQDTLVRIRVMSSNPDNLTSERLILAYAFRVACVCDLAAHESSGIYRLSRMHHDICSSI